MLTIHADSHLDHNLTPAQVQHLLATFQKREGFFVETVELPKDLGTVPCALYGPLMGDPPVPEDQATYAPRGDRPRPSRLVPLPTRPTRLVTVVAGPYDGQNCVLYTAYGGLPAPKEPGDPTLKVEEKEQSEKFWATHALAAG